MLCRRPAQVERSIMVGAASGESSGSAARAAQAYVLHDLGAVHGAGRLDRRRIGAYGHSMGARATAAAMYYEHRARRVHRQRLAGPQLGLPSKGQELGTVTPAAAVSGQRG